MPLSPRALPPLAAALALLATATVTSSCKKKAEGKWDMPIDVKTLPKQTNEVEAEVIDGTRETDPRIKQYYTAAELGAEVCRANASDPARELEIIGTAGARAAKDFFKQTNLDTVQSLMECGELLTANITSNYQTALGFTDDTNVKQMVGLLQLKATDIPPKYGLTKRAFSGLDGFCRTSDPMKPNAPTMDCTVASDAALHQGNSWFFGRRGALDTLAHTVSTPNKDLSTQVSALSDAASATEGLSSLRIQAAQSGSAKNFLMAPCVWGGLQSAGSTTDFVTSCFPQSDQKTIDDIDAKLRAEAFEIEPDVVKANGVHGNVVLVARDNDAAKEVEKDAQELASDWKSQLENNEAKLIKQAKTNPVSRRQKAWAVIVDNFLHSLEKMKVIRDGRTVRLNFNDPLDPTDKSELDDADKQTADKRAAVADVLDAIENKKPLPQGSLAKLVGAPWATYLAQTAQSLAAPLSAAECGAVKKTLAKIKTKDVPGKDALAFYSELRNMDCARPPQMTASTHSCVTAIKAGSDIGPCAPAQEPPDSQYGELAKK
jgi:hypothetical protein